MLKNHSNTKFRGFLALTVAMTTLILAPTAGAAIHQLGDSGWSAAVNSEWDISFSVDGYTDRAVIIGIQKTFVGGPDEFGLMPAMYVEFIKDSQEAFEQIIITDEYIINGTTENWIDFHMELAIGASQRAGFCKYCIPSGDQFETVTLSGTNGYNELPTRIDFCDGLVPNAPAGENTFRPGYAHDAIVIVTNPALQVGQRILLKEFPTIPEPATMLVLSLGALGFATAARKQR